MKYFFPRRRLTTGELLLIPEALFQLIMSRIKVSLFHSKFYISTPLSQNAPIKILPDKIEKGRSIAGVINGLSTRTPWPSTCLVKALAAQKMLTKRKIPHVIHFGVIHDQSSKMKAHAWLSLNTEVIIGGEIFRMYHELHRVSSK